MEIADDVACGRFAEDQAFEKAVGGEAIGAMQARLGDFPAA
jgi:hypothetical protein